MGKNHRTAGLLVNKIRFDQKQNMWLFVCSEAVESRLAKLETSCTAVPPPTVSGLCCVFHKSHRCIMLKVHFTKQAG